MIPVGYLTSHADGLHGEKGQLYNYILASNGLFIEAEGPLLTARVPVAECLVRGLAPVESRVSMLYGSIPVRFWHLALNLFLSDTSKEHYAAVTGAGGYHFYLPSQTGEPGKVVYQTGDHIVLDLHSHGDMLPSFSSKDNDDELGLKLYGVVGKLNTTPAVKLRVGVYGYFMPLRWKTVFDGDLNGAVEYDGGDIRG